MVRDPLEILISTPRPQRALATLLLSIVLVPALLHASFDNGVWGVRAAGMGGAFVALADDASAPFWNPAGTAFTQRVQSAFMWERAYPGLTDVDIRSGFLSLVVPSRFGSMGGAVTSYSYGSMLSENIVLLHYGREVVPALGIGINLKYLTHDYKIGKDPSFAANPVFANGTSAGNVTFDLGALYKVGRSVSLGIAGRNLTEPDVGLRSTDRVSSEFQGGAAWAFNPRWMFEADLAYKNAPERDFKSKMEAAIGAEYRAWRVQRFGAVARIGINRDFSADQKKAFKNVTAGFTLESDLQNWLAIALDYAFLLNVNLAGGYSEVNQSGTHQIGISLLFGAPAATPAGSNAPPVPLRTAQPLPAPAAAPVTEPVRASPANPAAAPVLNPKISPATKSAKPRSVPKKKPSNKR